MASDSSTLAAANAPVSFGAFEITVGRNRHVPAAEALLAAVSDAGYSGIDLGPVGYLGDADTIGQALHDHGLGLAGGYIQLAFSEPTRLADQMVDLDALLEILHDQNEQPFPPRPTLADDGSPARRQHPGAARADRSAGLDTTAWRRFRDGLNRVSERCLESGLEPTLHPHAGTFVEAAWEIERLLEDTTIGICFDPGHLLVGGVDPLQAMDDWGQRVNHLHVKDVHADVLRRLRDARAPLDDYYAGRVFCRLGDGDIDVTRIIEQARALGYHGWAVVEQDFIPDSDTTMRQAIADQAWNRAYLRDIGV